MSTEPNPWLTAPDHSDLISIGTHSLHLSITGAPRTHPSHPLILVFTGAGDITFSWLPVRRLLPASLRVLFYDRSGLGKSERGPNRLVASAAAGELLSALKAAGLDPPYILCAHSYGAIVSREFLHLLPAGDVVGMVLADPSTERQHLFFRVPDDDIDGVMGNMNYAKVTGLREDAKLSREEWRERAKLLAKGVDAAKEEAMGFVEVCETLGGKRQVEKKVLKGRPLSIIRANSKRDFERIYEKGVEEGNGSVEQRGRFRELLDRFEDVDRDLKERLLGLTDGDNGKLVRVLDCGHNLQLCRPDVIIREIEWVVERVSGKEMRKGGKESLL
ncbi:alpha/beta hydrolase [Apodospora peruviana]|uniref:Alpha/beta hydrolase n=1 Tax=Apodospora peruviana TaxID=516989 RepID=A0AAE0HSP9_9PEZI|nr:alpha/beta hydrolase [Apodospora peruviana]